LHDSGVIEGIWVWQSFEKGYPVICGISVIQMIKVIVYYMKIMFTETPTALGVS
jgi:hypothetical protein